MSHYVCVTVTEDVNLEKVRSIMDKYVFEYKDEPEGVDYYQIEDTDKEDDGIMDYYQIGECPYLRFALKSEGIGYIATDMSDEFEIGVDQSGKCDCAKSSDIDFTHTDFGVPYLCFMPDGSYWYWSCSDERNKREWKEVINDAIKNGWYLTVADCHI